MKHKMFNINTRLKSDCIHIKTNIDVKTAFKHFQSQSIKFISVKVENNYILRVYIH